MTRANRHAVGMTTNGMGCIAIVCMSCVGCAPLSPIITHETQPCLEVASARRQPMRVYKAGKYVGHDNDDLLNATFDSPSTQARIEAVERMRKASIFTGSLLPPLYLATLATLFASARYNPHGIANEIPAAVGGSLGATVITTITLLVLTAYRRKTAIDDYNAWAEVAGCRDLD